MVVNRRTGPDDEADARRQRAFDLFAAWLESHDEPRELDESSFAALVGEHPDLSEELRALRAGLETFRSIRPSRLRAALDAPPRLLGWRGWTLRVVAAALLVAAAGIYWRIARRPERPPAQTPTLAAAVVDCGVRWVDEMVMKSGFIESTLRNARGLPLPPSTTAGAADGENEAAEQFTKEAVQGVADVFSIVKKIADDSGAATAAAAAPGLGRIRATLSEDKPGSWRRRILHDIDAPEAGSDPAKPFLFVLARDPAVRDVLARSSGLPTADESLAKLIAGLTRKAVLGVRAIDLDADGADFDGGIVYAQPVALPGDELGAPIRLGVTPLPPTGLDSGDWRITVVDRQGKESRFSEIRVLANPGEDLGTRVLFLRTTSEVTAKMAAREACTAKFGAPADQKPTEFDLPETVRRVEKLWIDPYEVTCAEYSEFYLDVTNHLEWFDGTAPVHRPKVLASDGTCPPKLVRRPIVDVTWKEAVLYADWAGKRLPTELEWERVARGNEAEDRQFPWGSDWDDARVNLTLSIGPNPKKNGMVGGQGVIWLPNPRYEDMVDEEVDAPKYLAGSTPAESGDKVYRLADDVSEYVEDLFVSCMSTPNPKITHFGILLRVIKGSDWVFAGEVTCPTWKRNGKVMNLGGQFVGFRCVKSAAPSFGDH